MAGLRAVSTADRLAYVDDCLPRIDRAAVEDRMREDAELKSQIDFWLTQNDAIRAAFPDHAAKRAGAGWTVADWLMVPELSRPNVRRAPEGSEPADRARVTRHAGDSLRKAVAPTIAPAPPAAKPRPRARIVVGLAAALALWSGAAILFSGKGGEPFAKAATAAYRTYAEGKVRPVETATSDRAALNKWFAAQTAGAAPVPDLTEAGLILVGGRIVPGASSPATFAVYETLRHERFAIEMEVVDAPPETDFVIDDAGGILCASWTGAGHSFAIVGRASRARIDELARLVREASRI
jgi:anti-sigma factor RsiW